MRTITRMTVTATNVITAEFNPHKYEGQEQQLKIASVEAEKIGDIYTKAGEMFSYLAQYPQEENIIAAYHNYFKETPKVKHYSKIKTTYSFFGVVVTVEDIQTKQDSVNIEAYLKIWGTQLTQQDYPKEYEAYINRHKF